jgi:hypothetical protein
MSRHQDNIPRDRAMNNDSPFYSIIHLCPDPFADERAAAGVILIHPQFNYIGIALTEHFCRIENFFARHDIDRVALLSEINNTIERIRLEKPIQQDSFREFAATRSNRIVLTAPRWTAVQLPDITYTLLQLYRRLFSDYPPGSLVIHTLDLNLPLPQWKTITA